MKQHIDIFGELLGTFILVFIGCGSIAIAVLYYPLALWQIALIWSVGVASAIYAVQNFCSAHLNPAVTLAMVLARKCSWQKLPFYFVAQFSGAFLGGLLLFIAINTDLQNFELANGIVRGDAKSYQTAVMFGEFFPDTVSHFTACLAEGLGTFTLVLTIFLLDAKNTIVRHLSPTFIGLTVGAIILVIAPYTQAGLNPARDFGPRLVAYFGGWEDAAFPSVQMSFFTVYILGPLLGASLASFCFILVFKW